MNDSYQVRIYLIFIHISFFFIKFKTKNYKEEIKNFSQKLFYHLFKKIEEDMRESGHGDIAVNKKMKILIKTFYDILLNFEKYRNLENKNKINLLKKYFEFKEPGNINNLIELVKYLDKYQSFCFDLSLNSVIQGDFDFKY